MRAVLFVSSLTLLAAPALAQDDDTPVESSEQAPRKCIAAQVIVPTFNNTPEAMEQSRIAATIVAGSEVCRTSTLIPELSELKHGPEEVLEPEDVESVEPAEEAEPV